MFRPFAHFPKWLPQLFEPYWGSNITHSGLESLFLRHMRGEVLGDARHASEHDISRIVSLPPVKAPDFVHDLYISPDLRVNLPSHVPVHLDFEAGYGHVALAMARNHPEKHVVAYDDSGWAFSGFIQSGREERKNILNFSRALESLWKGAIEFHRSPKPTDVWSWEQGLLASYGSTQEYFRLVKHTESLLSSLRASQKMNGPKDEYLSKPRPVEQLRRHMQLQDKASEELCLLDFNDDGTMYQKERIEAYHRAIDKWGQDVATTPAVISFLFQLSSMAFFYDTFAPSPEQIPVPNVTVVRGPSSVNEGFRSLPFEDHSIHSLSWLGPFRHASDGLVIMDELSRVLAPDWTDIAVSVFEKEHEQDLPYEALAAWAIRLGGVLVSVPTADEFQHSVVYKDLVHYRIDRADL